MPGYEKGAYPASGPAGRSPKARRRANVPDRSLDPHGIYMEPEARMDSAAALFPVYLSGTASRMRNCASQARMHKNHRWITGCVLRVDIRQVDLDSRQMNRREASRMAYE
jgi:hypothetical protein